MARYIDADELKQRAYPFPCAIGVEYAVSVRQINEQPTADVVEAVRCKNCEYHHWEQEPCHGRTEHFCSVLKAEVFKDFYCYYGKRKETNNDR